MKGTLIIFFCISGLAFTQQSTEEQPLVTAPIGKIRGSIFTSRLGRKIYSFRGIRYGEPPVGEQRFQVRNFVFSLLLYAVINSLRIILTL